MRPALEAAAQALGLALTPAQVDQLLAYLALLQSGKVPGLPSRPCVTRRRC